MKQDHYKNIGIVILALVLLAHFLKSKFDLENNYLLFGVLAFGAILYTFESLAKAFSKLWMSFGKALGFVNSKIILSVFFALILSPLALLKRCFGSKNLGSNSSAWLLVENKEEDFTKPW
ncbi:MAG: hypothetical protein H6579_04845 [Chitinophagales bacterium]|nr:hypothetical protein [Bacteroidota bacterium]MCB9256436.1 hypothetical protein [Chitinophagales bacterium]